MWVQILLSGQKLKTMETKLKELDPEKIKMFGKLKETCSPSELDDGTPFITKEKTRAIMKKFKIIR